MINYEYGKKSIDVYTFYIESKLFFYILYFVWLLIESGAGFNLGYTKEISTIQDIYSVGAETNVHNSQEAIIDIKI